MNERSALILALACLYLGHALAEGVGDNAFHILLLAGWVIAIIWTIVAYRRGERVFIWQKRNG